MDAWAEATREAIRFKAPIGSDRDAPRAADTGEPGAGKPDEGMEPQLR